MGGAYQDEVTPARAVRSVEESQDLPGHGGVSIVQQCRLIGAHGRCGASLHLEQFQQSGIVARQPGRQQLGENRLDLPFGSQGLLEQLDLHRQRLSEHQFELTFDGFQFEHGPMGAPTKKVRLEPVLGAVPERHQAGHHQLVHHQGRQRVAGLREAESVGRQASVEALVERGIQNVPQGPAFWKTGGGEHPALEVL
jgi:hypothetical protein